jgi:hypothetical protein
LGGSVFGAQLGEFHGGAGGGGFDLHAVVAWGV